jgi:hypothetical protein
MRSTSIATPLIGAKSGPNRGTGADQDARRTVRPRQWKGHTFYSREELAAMTPDEYQSALLRHRTNPVRDDELPPDFVAHMKAKLAEQVEEFEARRQQATP